MDRRLVDVSQAGNMEAFYALLEDEPHILDFVDDVLYTRTPLHLAVLARKSEFAKEIASLRPSFITKIDRYGYSPIHLAAENGQVDMVRWLLEKSSDESGTKNNNEVVVIRGGKEKRILSPLHVAVISGKTEVVKFLVKYYPRCIMELTVKNETALHLAVKNKQMTSLLVLLDQMKVIISRSEVNVGDMNKLLNFKDGEGNTILHLAIMMHQLQIVQVLLNKCSGSPPPPADDQTLQVDINALNSKNCSGLDLLMELPEDKRDANIENILRQAGARSAKRPIQWQCVE